MAFEQSKKYCTEVLVITTKGGITFYDDNSRQQTIAFKGFYGAFSDYTTQSIANINNSYAMTFNTTDESNGVSIVNNSRITFANAGTYNLQWSGQFGNTSTGDADAYVWLRKNGVDVVGSTGYINVPSKHGTTSGHNLAGWNFVFTVAANDYYELIWGADSLSVTIDTVAALSNPTRPSTASLVLTVTQVR